MHFHYPHRFYFVAMLLLVALILYGSIVLHEIYLEGNLHIYMVFTYGAVCLLIGRFYYRKYKYYAVRHIDVFMDQVDFCIDQACIAIPIDDLDLIVLARHRQMLKIHTVVHFLSKSGTYVYVTSDLVRFKRFQLLLEYYYPKHWIVATKLIKGYNDITLEFLLDYIEPADLMKLRKK